MHRIISSGRVSYERQSMLEIVFDRLVRITPTSLRNFTSDNVEVSIDNLLSLRFGDYLNSIALPAMLAVFKAEDHAGVRAGRRRAALVRRGDAVRRPGGPAQEPRRGMRDGGRGMMAGWQIVARGLATAASVQTPAVAASAAPPRVPSGPPPPAVSERERRLLQDPRGRRLELETRERTLTQREGVLDAAEQRLTARVTQLSTLQARLEQPDQARRERDEANWTGLVKVYETMKPREAAAIFDDMDAPVLLNVLDRMKEAKAAEVLAAMQPDRACLATVQLAARRTRATAAPAPLDAG